MIQIKDTLVTLDLIEQFFLCDLDSCKGECCIEGDAVPPISKEEYEENKDNKKDDEKAKDDKKDKKDKDDKKSKEKQKKEADQDYIYSLLKNNSRKK